MTNQEAVDTLEEVKTLDDSMFAYSQAYNDALDMAIKALKAQEPVKPYGMYSEHTGTKWLTCGACNNPMIKITPDAVYPNYCPECGRKVWWE